MTAQAQQQFPAACAPLKPEVLEQRVRAQIAKARRHDITTKKDVCDFIAVCFTLGDDFDSAPELPWAAETLSDSTLPTGSSKMTHLLEQVFNHLERKTPWRGPQ